MILLTVFLTISFYESINDQTEQNGLIKENRTSEKKESLVQNFPTKPNKEITTKRPSEGLSLLIGQDLKVLLEKLGTPNRIDQSFYGYQWYIYNQDSKHYVQVGVESNRVVTLFALGENLDIAPYEIGQPVAEIYNTQYMDTNITLTYNQGTYSFELSDTDFNLRPMVQLGDIYAQLFIDRFTGNLSSVRFIDAPTLIKMRPYELVYNGELLEAANPTESQWRGIENDTEKQIFDLTNVLRVRHKLNPLMWSEPVAQIAYEHSMEMAEVENSNSDKKLDEITDRLKKENINFKDAGENIAADYSDGPAVVEGWLNSKGHREMMLNKHFTHIGVGVYQKYFTQSYIEKEDSK